MEQTSSFDLISSVVPALVLVVGAPLGIWLWTRRTQRTSTHRLRITDKAAFGRSTWVAVVEVDDRRLLVGAGESGVKMLSELEQTPEQEKTYPEPVEGFPTGETNGLIERPRTGLIRRLQQMTLRSPAPPSKGPIDATHS